MLGVYGEAKELQSLTGVGRLLNCVEAALDGQVVMVVLQSETLDTQEKIVVSDGEVIELVVADGHPAVGSIV